MATILDVIRACREIKGNEKASPKARNYAHAALYMGNDAEALKTQCLYILCNIPYWRGTKAREIRQTLKEFAGIEK